MSAGTSAPLTLHFEPKLDEDIEFELPLLTQTGPMSLPVRALCKKVVLHFYPYPHPSPRLGPLHPPPPSSVV